MATRCTTHFQDNGVTVAIVYRHWDGYPEAAGTDLLRFIDECAALQDSRLNDPSMLAARYVVFLADMFRSKEAKPLDFLSVRVEMQDPGDIEFRYVVECGERSAGHQRNGKPAPTVRCFAVGWSNAEHEIPEPEVVA